MNTFSGKQTFFLVVLRILIGWHFLYEGIVKVLNPKWTSLAYLSDSQGWLAETFRSLATNPEALNIVNFLNEWGLVLIGLGLTLGCLTRVSIIGGVILLCLYYLSHPPFIGAEYMMPSEGTYLWVDKNLIEAAVLLVLYQFPTWQIFGLDGYLLKLKQKITSKKAVEYVRAE